MMNTVLKQHGFTAYLLIAAIHVGAILFNQEDIRFISKPLLMPLLALAVYGNCVAGKERNIIITAILFSFLGDCFLLFDNKNSFYFILGLLSFLITHILYIVYFLQTKPWQPSLLKKMPWITLFVLAYGISLVYFLYPTLEQLKIPVIIYATIICSMLLASIHIFKRLNKGAAALFIVGAIFFVISDSLLAINKFYTSFSGAAFLIMFTYCAAQYCIAKGIIKANKAG